MTPRDPDRLASLGSEPELSEMLRSAQRRLPDDELVGRLAARFGVVPPPSGPSLVPPPAAVASALPVVLKVLLGVGAAGACALAFVALSPRPVDVNRDVPRTGATTPINAAKPAQDTPPAPRSLSDLPIATATGPVIPLEALATDVPPSASGASTRAGAASNAGAPSEAELVTGAQRALRSEPARTLALADEHRKLYPRGVLAEEREVLAIEALAALGKKGAAKARARAFGDASPDSPYARRIAKAVGDE